MPLIDEPTYLLVLLLKFYSFYYQSEVEIIVPCLQIQLSVLLLN